MVERIDDSSFLANLAMTSFDHEAYFEKAGEDGVRAMLQAGAGLDDSSMSALPGRAGTTPGRG